MSHCTISNISAMELQLPKAQGFRAAIWVPSWGAKRAPKSAKKGGVVEFMRWLDGSINMASVQMFHTSM